MEAFLPVDHIHIVHRKSLFVGSLGIPASHTQREFSLREPVGHLPPIARIYRLLIDKQLAEKVRSQLRIVKEKLKRRPDPGARRLLRNELPLPSRIHQV